MQTRLTADIAEERDGGWQSAARMGGTRPTNDRVMQTSGSFLERLALRKLLRPGIRLYRISARRAGAVRKRNF